MRRVIIMPECETDFLIALKCEFEKLCFKYYVRHVRLAQNYYGDFCRQFDWDGCCYRTFLMMTVIFKESDAVSFCSVVDCARPKCGSNFRISANPQHCLGRSSCFEGSYCEPLNKCDPCDDPCLYSYYNGWRPCNKGYYHGCSEYYNGKKWCVLCKCGECDCNYDYDYCYRDKKNCKKKRKCDDDDDVVKEIKSEIIVKVPSEEGPKTFLELCVRTMIKIFDIKI